MDAEALVRPVIEAAGLELVEVGLRRDGGRRVLRVTVDRDGGVDLDTISELSEMVSRRLDLEGYAPGPYSLEVTSPGIERALKRPEHYRRAVGMSVRVKTVETPDGSRHHLGKVVSADDLSVVLDTGNGELRVPYADIWSARTVADWDAELKGSTR